VRGHYDLIDFVAVLIGYILVFRTDPAGFLRTARSICRAIYSLVWARIVCPIARRFLVFPDVLDPASVEGLRSLCAKGLACAEAVSFCWWPV
jgi:hypothetical protein